MKKLSSYIIQNIVRFPFGHFELARSVKDMTLCLKLPFVTCALIILKDLRLREQYYCVLSEKSAQRCSVFEVIFIFSPNTREKRCLTDKLDKTLGDPARDYRQETPLKKLCIKVSYLHSDRLADFSFVQWLKIKMLTKTKANRDVWGHKLFIHRDPEGKRRKGVFYPSLCSPIYTLLAFQQMEANKTIISNIRLGAAFVYRNDTASELHAGFVCILSWCILRWGFH